MSLTRLTKKEREYLDIQRNDEVIMGDSFLYKLVLWMKKENRPEFNGGELPLEYREKW